MTNNPVLVTKTPVLNSGDVNLKRQEILRYFHDTFSLYESIFECLADDEAYYIRPNTLRHPLIFYYGHTSVFFINKLAAANLINKRVDPTIESVLAVGVDEMSWDDLDDNHYEWPTVQKVRAHRNNTRAAVDEFIKSCECTLPIAWDHPLWIVMMGIEHERIHLETTSVLIRELPLKSVVKHPVWGRICRETYSAPENEFLDVKGGTVTLGKSRSNPLYGWDNEYGSSSQTVNSYHASKFLVSNREFKTFIDAGGYSEKKYWTEEGWKWLKFRKAQHPVYWVQEADKFSLRTMLEVIDMPWDWPVEVNYLEAKAFCNWMSDTLHRKIRLPTEAEWYLMRERVRTDQPYWEQAPGNINLEGNMSPCPVTEHEFAGGLFDIIGNVWQWTETPVEPFSEFEVHPTYDDFSTPTFDGKHNIFKGGCWISTGNYAIKDSRYAFRRHFFQHSGFRYVEAEPLAMKKVNAYETDSLLSMYTEFHWGQSYLGVDNFPVRCVSEVEKLLDGHPCRKALDIGCATGRSTFELAKIFEVVDGLDFSARLIGIPVSLQKMSRQRYVIQDEGELVSYREVYLSDFEGYEEVKDRISFVQGDACNLAEKYSGYDLVFAGNLIDRLYDPARFLQVIKNRICDGGLLVLTSPYTWLEEYTPRDRWLGGFKAKTGENYTTLQGIQENLGSEFELIAGPLDVPMVIRETRRKFQHTFPQFTAWRFTKASKDLC